MTRATGWYKRYNRAILFYIGLGIAVSFNVDTIAITKKLAKDPELREQLLQQTEIYIATNREFADYKKDTDTNEQIVKDYEYLLNKQKELLDSANNLLKNDIGSLNAVLGLGYGQIEKKKLLSFMVPKISFTNMIGLLLTAMAISLGAPFWFDLLNKLMKLRNSAKLAGTKSNEDNIRPPVGVTQPVPNINNTSNTGEEAVG